MNLTRSNENSGNTIYIFLGENSKKERKSSFFARHKLIEAEINVAEKNDKNTKCVLVQLIGRELSYELKAF